MRGTAAAEPRQFRLHLKLPMNPVIRARSVIPMSDGSIPSGRLQRWSSMMRNLLKVCAAAAFVLISGLSLSQRAEAMPIAPAATLATDGLATTVQYYGCPPVWRCGPWGCGWRRICYGGPIAPYGFYGGYRPYYGYGYRPYYRYGFRPWGPRWGYRRW
jgi:hypothetical protein